MKREISVGGVIIAIALAIIYGSIAHAAISPVGLAFVHKVEFPPEDFTITGVRASALWGIHRSVYGFDLSAGGNITTQNFTGVAVSGVFNSTAGIATAIGTQAAGFANFNSGKLRVLGVQLAGAVNRNIGETSIIGVQAAAVNLAEHTKVYGFQVGLYNVALEVYGFQIGIINKVDQLHGFQIGLLNFNTRGLFAVSPVLNVGF